MIRRLATPAKRRRAVALRRDPPRADAELWQLLRKGQLHGHRFRRRAIVEGWIPDFWCPSAKLAIEIDASANARKMRRDAMRDPLLLKRGVRTLHISAADIFDAPDRVIAQVLAAIEDRLGDSYR